MRLPRRALALLTAGLLLGVSGVPTLASWTDSEYSANTFTSAGFDIEVSTSGAATGYQQHRDSPGTLQFTGPAQELQPGDVVYASSWVRLGTDSTVGGSFTTELRQTDNDDTLDNATWAIYRIDPDATCDARTATGTPVASGQTLTHLAGQERVPLTPGADGQPGGPVHLCYAVTARDDVERNASVRLSSGIDAQATDKDALEDVAFLTAPLRSGGAAGLEGSTQDRNGPYAPHPQDQPGELLFTPAPLRPGASSATAHLWIRPIAGSPRPLTLTGVHPDMQTGTTLEGSWQLNTVAADGSCSGSPVARGDNLAETTAVQPAELRADGPTPLCLQVSFPQAQPGGAFTVNWELEATSPAHPGVRTSIFFAGTGNVPDRVLLEGSTQSEGGPYASHEAQDSAAALTFSPHAVAAGATATAPLWLRTDADSPHNVRLSAVTPTVGANPGFDASWQLIDTARRTDGCSPTTGTVLARGDSLQRSELTGELVFTPEDIKALCVRVTAHAGAPEGAAVNVTWRMEGTAASGSQPSGAFFASAHLTVPTPKPIIHVSPTGADGSFTTSFEHELTARPEQTAQNLRPGDAAYVPAWVRVPDPSSSELVVTTSTPETVGDKPRLSAPWSVRAIGANETCDGSVSSRPTLSDGPDLDRMGSVGQGDITRDATVQLCFEIRATEATRPGSAVTSDFYLETLSGGQRSATHLQTTLQAAPAFGLEASTQGPSGGFASHSDASNPAALTFAPEAIASGQTAAAPLWIRLAPGTTTAAAVRDLPAPTLTPGGDSLRNASWEVIGLAPGAACSPTADGTVLGGGASFTEHTTGTSGALLSPPGQDGSVIQLCYRVTAHDGNPASSIAHLTWDVAAQQVDHPDIVAHAYASGTVTAPTSAGSGKEAPAAPGGAVPDGVTRPE